MKRLEAIGSDLNESVYELVWMTSKEQTPITIHISSCHIFPNHHMPSLIPPTDCLQSSPRRSSSSASSPPSSNYPHISSSNSCPYIPFLSQSQPPPDCHIEIQTFSNHYSILVSLPGFTTQDITLATKRRRILHLVADKWGEGGGQFSSCFSFPRVECTHPLFVYFSSGHFEKKVVFGYDADLSRVRAEFNGSMLTISIPRRTTSDLLH